MKHRITPTMLLSEAIRLGAMIRPQAFGTLRDKVRGRWATCAMGAAYEAGGLRDRRVTEDTPVFTSRGERKVVKAGDTVYDMPPHWATTRHLPARCPVGGCSNSEVKLGRVIPHLNDDHRWPRERIADFVKILEDANGIKALVPNTVEAKKRINV